MNSSMNLPHQICGHQRTIFLRVSSLLPPFFSWGRARVSLILSTVLCTLAHKLLADPPVCVSHCTVECWDYRCMPPHLDFTRAPEIKLRHVCQGVLPAEPSPELWTNYVLVRWPLVHIRDRPLRLCRKIVTGRAGCSRGDEEKWSACGRW